MSLADVTPVAALLAAILNIALGHHSGERKFLRYLVGAGALFYAVQMARRQYGWIDPTDVDALIQWSESLLPMSTLVFIIVWSSDVVLDAIDHRLRRQVIEKRVGPRA